MWYLYIVKCSDDSYYTGITADAESRIERHNQGKASDYTKRRRPVRLLYLEKFESKILAERREIEVKKYSIKNKERLIRWGPVNKVSLATENLNSLARDCAPR